MQSVFLQHAIFVLSRLFGGDKPIETQEEAHHALSLLRGAGSVPQRGGDLPGEQERRHALCLLPLPGMRRLCPGAAGDKAPLGHPGQRRPAGSAVPGPRPVRPALQRGAYDQGRGLPVAGGAAGAAPVPGPHRLPGGVQLPAGSGEKPGTFGETGEKVS